jgi:molybdenum cofactor guanylyltransferase
MPATTDHGAIVGVILAGGRGTRMGDADKPLLSVSGKPMLARVIERLRPQVDRLVLNANGDPVRFVSFGLPVVSDTVEGFAGPLAGIFAGMRWAAQNAPGARFIVSVAADTPFFPPDLVSRLAAAGGELEDAIPLAASATGVHPVFALWPTVLADALEESLASGRNRKVVDFADAHGRIDVPFEAVTLADGTTVDPFFNVNAPEDVTAAEKIALALQSP